VRQLFGWIAGLAVLVALNHGAGAQTSPAWDLRRTPESCYLFRSFATVAGKMDVRIQSYGPTTPYHFILHGPGMLLRKDRAEKADIAFGDHVPEAQTIVLVGEANDLPMVIFAAGPARPSSHINMLSWFYAGTGGPAYLRAPLDPNAGTLSVRLPDSDPLALDLGPMREEYARLDACAQGLSDTWSQAIWSGADPATAPEMIDPQATLQLIRFPAVLAINRVSGLVELRMKVDANGRARDCVVQSSSGSSQFGEQSCDAVMKKARFEPAHDAQGNPVAALYQTAIMYVIYRW
jgi:TonB family protein